MVFVGASPPSIPSKYQTVVIDNSDNKGFLSKSKRFNYDLLAVSTLSSPIVEAVKEGAKPAALVGAWHGHYLIATLFGACLCVCVCLCVSDF